MTLIKNKLDDDKVGTSTEQKGKLELGIADKETIKKEMEELCKEMGRMEWKKENEVLKAIEGRLSSIQNEMNGKLKEIEKQNVS